MSRVPKIVLLGVRDTGKTTLAQALKVELERRDYCDVAVFDDFVKTTKLRGYPISGYDSHKAAIQSISMILQLYLSAIQNTPTYDAAIFADNITCQFAYAYHHGVYPEFLAILRHYLLSELENATVIVYLPIEINKRPWDSTLTSLAQSYRRSIDALLCYIAHDTRTSDIQICVARGDIPDRVSQVLEALDVRVRCSGTT